MECHSKFLKERIHELKNLYNNKENRKYMLKEIRKRLFIQI